MVDRGGEVRLSGENNGQLDDGLCSGVDGGDRGGGRRGSRSLTNPRSRCATRPTDSAGADLGRPTSSPDLRRLLLAEESSAGSPYQQGWQPLVGRAFVRAAHPDLKQLNFLVELQLVRAEARNA